MIQCENLVKIYKTRETEVVALQGLDLTVEDGELMAIIGNSGSGKSTLLNMIGGLDRPSAGTLLVDGKDLLKFKEKDYITYKRDTVGFVWQNNARNLIPYMTALENVQVPMVLTSRKDRVERARQLLETVGLANRAGSKLSQFPAVSSSGWRSRSPWPIIPSCCWLTSLPVRWIALRPT